MVKACMSDPHNFISFNVSIKISGLLDQRDPVVYICCVEKLTFEAAWNGIYNELAGNFLFVSEVIGFRIGRRILSNVQLVHAIMEIW